MVAELTENFAGWERIENALGEIRACHEETLTFLNGAFDQLDLLCESLAAGEQQAAERKRPAVLQQSQWADELRQMRTILEALARQIAENKRDLESAPAVKPPIGIAEVASNDPVLESILTQFEYLRQDRLLRGLENSECVKENNA